MSEAEKRANLFFRLAQTLNAVSRLQPNPFALKVLITGFGGGSVKRSPELENYTKGQVVSLTAMAKTDSIFAGWSGDALGAHFVCNIRMDTAKSVSARFEPSGKGSTTKIVTDLACEQRIGRLDQFITNGNGTVTDRRSGLMWKRTAENSSPADGTAGTCNFHRASTTCWDYAGHSDWRLPTVEELKDLLYLDIPTSERIRFKIKLLDEKAFLVRSTRHFWTSTLGQSSEGRRAGWPVIIDLETGLTEFGNPQVSEYCALLVRDRIFFHLAQKVTGNGAGIVTRVPSLEKYVEGTQVVVTAIPEKGCKFVSWNGDAKGRNATCAVTMDSSKEVSAEFAALETFSLTTVSTGLGNGAIERSLVAEQYIVGEKVTLTARAEVGSKFRCWGGDATGDSTTCTVTMDSVKSVSAEFVALETFTLAVASIGTGDGKVRRSPIANQYVDGAQITLTAHANPGSKFKCWHGDASGLSDTCVVTMDSEKRVSAEFVALKSS